MVRFRHYDGFTGLTEQEKYSHAKQLIEDYTAKLRSGWSPFAGNHEVIYMNNIDYKSVAEMYQSKRAGNRTLRLVISRYLEFKRPSLAYSSFQTYSSSLRIFSMWTEQLGMEKNDIKSYSNAVILSFFDYLINTKKLSGKSIRKYTDLLFSLFNYCIDKKLIKKNPVFNIPRCKRINDNAARPIMRADLEAFKAEIKKDPELWLMVQFEYYCGLRPGHEIREMKISDIDLVAGIIYIGRSTAKTGAARVVTIPRQFLTYLRANIDTMKWNRDYFLFGKGGIPGPVPIGKNMMGERFREIRRTLNMPRQYKLYSFKHTSVVEIDESLIPAKDLSRHLGHSSISITHEYMKNKKPALSVAIRDNYPDL